MKGIRGFLIAGIIAVSAAQVHAECSTRSCHRDFRTFTFKHQPVAKDCMLCHQPASQGIGHPLLGNKSFRLKAAEPDLCYECHKPFGKKKVTHGILSGGKCSDCHRVHGSNVEHLLPESKEPFCLMCHKKEEFTARFMHGPAAVGKCTDCHLPHESDVKGLLKSAVPGLCFGCHGDFGAAAAKSAHIHTPVKRDGCLSCHRPHSSASKYLLKEDTPKLCTDCHKKIAEGLPKTAAHDPVINGKACSNCHTSHFSESKSLLPLPEKELCLSCHGANKAISGRKGNILKEIENKKYLHGPIARGTCIACHAPHGTGTGKLLSGNYPSSFYMPYKDDGYSFCFRCHNNMMLKYPDTTIYTGFRNGNYNLHYVHVSNTRKGRSCRACHEPHGSMLPKMISNEGPAFGEWKIPIGFAKTDDGGSCAPGCHRAFTYSRTKPADYRNMSSAKAVPPAFSNASATRKR